MIRGVLLVNLGTPASPAVPDVRRYLREFLRDPRVIDLPAALRWLLVEGAILPFRPRRSAAAYAKVWTPAGSPLLVHGRALRDAVAARLGGGFAVEIAMRYGEPSIASALEALGRAGAKRVSVLPLFPQYSVAATGSALAQVARAMDLDTDEPPDCVRTDFYDDPDFIAAQAAVAGPRLDVLRPEYVLFSYHGLPERQVRRSDGGSGHCLAAAECCDALREVNRRCYRAQCFATTRALAAALGLSADRYATAFQSRLGVTPWIRPYTDRQLPELARRGVSRLAVLCPSFVADCLETLEEIGIRARRQWAELGGKELHLIPSLNAEPAWVEAVTRWVRAS